jgi:hypothetical protein
METATHVQVPDHLQIVHPVHTVIDQNVVMIVALQVTVQPVVRTEIVTPVHRHAQVQIVPIVLHVHTVIDQSVVMIVVHLVTVQPAVRTVTEIRVHRHVQVPIAQQVVHTETAIHDPRQINPAEATHTVAIAHARAMIATHVRLRVTANAVADQIGPEVASPMIAKNVHAVALAKSA